ncbi:MAG: response regulator transcription factor [Elusimicrobia bacterium]|nr:response regulator transcription factor [Elusimicrobiota bacterium]
MARILIIEDDAELQHLLGEFLFRTGHDVHYAFNGKEGYEKVLSLHPELVVLDLMLPVMSGIDVLKLVTGNLLTRDIPIIIITAYSDQANMLELSLKAQGAREYIKKPFHPKELVDCIRRNLQEAPKKPEAEPPPIVKGAVRLDLRFRTVWINDKRVATLPPTRAELCRILLQARKGVKKEAIIQSIWGKEGSDNLLEKTIQRLREDFGPGESHRIQTTSDGYELFG